MTSKNKTKQNKHSVGVHVLKMDVFWRTMFVWKLRISKIILQVQLHNSLVIKEKRVWLTVLFFMRYVETVERDASAS